MIADRLRRALFAGAALCFAMSAAEAQDQRLSLYCSNLEEQCREIANGFQRASGVAVAMIRKSTGEFYAQIKAEAADPKGDVWWGGPVDAHWAARADGLLQAYRSPRLAELSDWAQAHARRTGDMTTPIYTGAVGIGYNAELLAARGIAPPRCWADLAEPRFRNEVQIANPASSGTAYLFLVMTLARLGEDQGFAYLKALDRNINQYARSGDAPVKALVLGETGVGIAFLHGMTPQLTRGAPVRTVIPCEGTSYEMIGMSMLKGARNPEAARRFVDYALSREGQEINAKIGVAATPARPDAAIAEGAPDFAGVKLIPIDVARYADPRERARLLKRFETDVRGQAR